MIDVETDPDDIPFPPVLTKSMHLPSNASRLLYRDLPLRGLLGLFKHLCGTRYAIARI